jgi:hypothetical protein
MGTAPTAKPAAAVVTQGLQTPQQAAGAFSATRFDGDESFVYSQ